MPKKDKNKKHRHVFKRKQKRKASKLNINDKEIETYAKKRKSRRRWLGFAIALLPIGVLVIFGLNYKQAYDLTQNYQMTTEQADVLLQRPDRDIALENTPHEDNDLIINHQDDKQRPTLLFTYAVNDVPSEAFYPVAKSIIESAISQDAKMEGHIAFVNIDSQYGKSLKRHFDFKNASNMVLIADKTFESSPSMVDEGGQLQVNEDELKRMLDTVYQELTSEQDESKGE